MPVYGHKKWFWYKEPVAELDQDPPVTDTLYTALNDSRLCKIFFIATRQINDEADNKTLGLSFTINGVTTTYSSQIHNNNTWEYWYSQNYREGWESSGTVVHPYHWSPLISNKVLIQFKNTSAAGTNQQLDARIHYATWRPT